jgi:hypothetical protein
MHSSSLWLEKTAKAHSFTGASAARGVFLWGPVQERLECETLFEISGLM